MLKKIYLIFMLLVSASVMADITLSEGEQQWIKDNPTVTFAGDPNWLPYEAFDRNGNYIGIVAEHLKLIATITGLKFDIKKSKTWTESTNKAKQGLVDILSETDDSDLKSHLDFTKPYLSNDIVIAMLNSENYVESLNDIKTKRIALIKDYGYAPKIRRKYSDINFVTVNDIQSGLIAVASGKVDAMICTLALCSYTISELGINNVRIVGKTEFDTKLAFGVQKNLPVLLSILNKAIDQIPREQQQVILDSWIKDKFVERVDYTLTIQIVVFSTLLIVFILFWNRRLSKEINLRKQTEESLRRSDVRFRSLFSLSPDPAWIIENNHFVECNNAAVEVLGYQDRTEILNTHPSELSPPYQPDGEESFVKAEKMMALAKKNKLHRFEWIHKKNDNSEFTAEVTLSLLTLQGKELIYCTWRDISDRKRVEQELEKYRSHLEEMVEERTRDLAEATVEAERANKAKTEFLSSMSHELRTPMNAILGFSKILEMQSDRLDSSQLSHVREIINAGDHLLYLISELLDLAKIESGNIDVVAENVSISELIKQCISMISTQASERGIHIIDNVSEKGHIVFADFDKLKQVFVNLLSNAVKYNSQNGEIIIDSIVLSEEQLRIGISDTGEGLSDEDKKKLFTPFERLHKTKAIEGIGIGLVISKHLIEGMNGSISIESSVGEGSTFWIELPLVKP